MLIENTSLYAGQFSTKIVGRKFLAVILSVKREFNSSMDVCDKNMKGV